MEENDPSVSFWSSQLGSTIAFMQVICKFRELIFGFEVKPRSCQWETTSSGETTGYVLGPDVYKESMDHLK